MLRALLFICLVTLGVGGLLGCSKAPQGGNAVAEVDIVDASKFLAAYENAPADTKAQVNQIKLAIGSSDFVGALSQIETLTNAPGTTEEQKKTTADLSQQLQKKLAANASAGQ